MLTPAHNKGNIKRESGLNYVLSVGDMDTDLTDTQHATENYDFHLELQL